ncbi:DUF4257 domain-containing protein [Terribacillus sp. DMT04]|uniref:DUF4257 domain-containing protein n=1 Tax=Terribacillus sp. DMT04 TaxID=2850441 RepID=UPI001C2B7DE3|nr:DUF4257 domain-containing protein [Terribacillus sp. DMT04]QXE03594.1 DUF4257 domain-containing protein [Terribacillus sp. DMT04]
MIKLVLMAGIIGGVTGVISHLLRNGRVLIYPKRKQRPKGLYLGFIADFLFGSAAAIFAVTYLVSDSFDVKTIVGISILAGLSAENILLQKELDTERTKIESMDRINDRLSK